MNRPTKDDDFRRRAARGAKERAAIEAARRVVKFYRVEVEGLTMQSVEEYIDSLVTLDRAITALDQAAT